MAAGIFRALVEEDNSWQIGSAGTWAVEGLPAVPEAVDIMAARGIDLSRHRSRQVSPLLLQASRLVLVMEPGHQEAIASEFPHIASQVFLLSEMSSLWQPIPDPVGGKPEDFSSTVILMEILLKNGLERIRFLAR